ncbi:MAG: DUF5675 family protein [Candidatus Nanoarchaeia archaeon]|nr:DUF5675 family protein [Candidatus Nanoarchaeia archaeon]
MKKIVFLLLFMFCVAFTSFAQDDEPTVTLVLSRIYEGDDCTIGLLYLGQTTFTGEELCYTLENPWRNDEPEISSIPPGTYQAFLRISKGGIRIQLVNAPENVRSAIQIHVGNNLEDTIGCILVGLEVDRNNCEVKQSNDAMLKLLSKIFGVERTPEPEDELLKKNITLIIEGAEREGYWEE